MLTTIIIFCLLCLVLLGLLVFVIVVTIQKKCKLLGAVNISVIICNYARPKNIPQILAKLRNIPEIDDIVVAHGCAETYQQFENVTNVKHFELNDRYGAAQRYFAVGYTKHDIILILDDDFIPSRKLMDKMVQEMQKNPMSIVGPHSRTCDATGYRNEVTKYNFILPGLALVHKSLILSFLDHFEKYASLLESTKGNGDDLLFNYHCIKHFQIHPKKVSGPFRELDSTTGAYKTRPQHYSQRNELCQRLYSSNSTSPQIFKG
jgi:glycosyltransferase involved in cell wall biosynthesis